MVKYNSQFKAQVIHDYLDGKDSSNALSKKYSIPARRVCEWIQRYKLEGWQGLIRRRRKRQFSADFKLCVINYYQTHEASMAEVAAKYQILPAQISIWRKQFETDGFEALKSHRKGRPSKVKKSRKERRHLANHKEVERLKAELAKRNHELYETRMERDLLKKSLALSDRLKPKSKRK